MCGVFGYISNERGNKPNLKRLQAIAKVTERRGPHAFGFAWIDSRGRLRMFKQTGRISDHLGLLAMASDARMLIGHCRYATHGDPANNLHNHPHSADGGWIVHNGVIRNYEALVGQRDLWPVSECDSEVLGLMIEQMDGSLRDRSAGAMRAIEGAAVMLGLWNKPARMIVARGGNPLCIGTCKSGTYLASLRDAMPTNTKSVPDGTILEFTFDRKGQSHGKATRIEEREPAGDSGTPALWHGTTGRGAQSAVHRNATGPYQTTSRRTWGF